MKAGNLGFVEGMPLVGTEPYDQVLSLRLSLKAPDSWSFTIQKWEYLTVQVSSANPIQPDAIPLPVMGLINGQNAIQSQPIHEVVSRLGEEGWEMTGTLSTEELFGNYLFFKRKASPIISADSA